MDSSTNKLVARGILALATLAVLAAAAAGLLLGRAAHALPTPVQQLVELLPGMTGAPIGSGGAFNVTCDTTAAGVPIDSGVATDALAWNTLYCENLTTSSVFYGPLDAGAATFTNANHPCLSTTSSTCAKSTFSIDVKRSAQWRCKSAGSVVLTCIAGGG